MYALNDISLEYTVNVAVCYGIGEQTELCNDSFSLLCIVSFIKCKVWLL